MTPSGGQSKPLLRVLSLGAGVQSTTLALMAAHGEIERPDVAIFADTQWEPAKVYRHLNWLRPLLPFPVQVVTRGNLRSDTLDRRKPSAGRIAAIPWHTVNPDGSHGMGRRQCTSEYKLGPIMREVRRLLGKGMRDRISARSVKVALGISRDEAHRMRPSRNQYMVNHYPLVEEGLTRRECVRWLADKGYPEPPKSACLGCPFHDNAHWRALRDDSPEEFTDAAFVDGRLRQGDSRIRAIEYMHRQRVPLDEADLSPDSDPRQPDLFGNECEGMCGV